MSDEVKVIKKNANLGGKYFDRDAFRKNEYDFLLERFGIAKKYRGKTISIWLSIRFQKIDLYNKKRQHFLTYQFKSSNT